MTNKSSSINTFFKTSVILVLFLTMAGLVIFKTGVLDGKGSSNGGLSGIVSVMGTVKLADLNLSKREIRKINRAVAAHKATFRSEERRGGNEC